MRLIDAEAFEESIEQIEWYHLAGNGEMVQGATSGNGWYKEQDIYNAIEEAPTIEAKPIVHAHWNDDRRCTNCGGDAPFYLMADEYHESKYFPHCGALMDISISCSHEDDMESERMNIEVKVTEAENDRYYIDLEGIRVVIFEGKIDGWYIP